MEQEFLTRPEPSPRVSDAMIAMRLPSLVVFLASACFMCAPILYYGVSQQASSTNCWLIGGLLLTSATLRLWYPLSTISFSWFNMILGLWVFLSPLLLGYTDQTAYTVHSMALGVVIIGMSLASVFASKFRGTLLANASDDMGGLTPEGYPPHQQPPGRI